MPCYGDMGVPGCSELQCGLQPWLLWDCETQCPLKGMKMVIGSHPGCCSLLCFLYSSLLSACLSLFLGTDNVILSVPPVVVTSISEHTKSEKVPVCSFADVVISCFLFKLC